MTDAMIDFNAVNRLASRDPNRWSWDEHTGPVIRFGKHVGTRLTRLPIQYLRWMVAENVDRPIAQWERDRRGDIDPEIEVSHHAIDRASQRLLHIWTADRHSDPENGHYEGIAAWVHRMAVEAMAQDDRQDQDDGSVVYCYKTMRFVVKDSGGGWPTLVTVALSNRTRSGR